MNIKHLQGRVPTSASSVNVMYDTLSLLITLLVTPVRKSEIL